MIVKKMTAIFNDLRLLGRFGFRKAGFPGYQIHAIEVPGKDLIYIPIPKNACSTIKHALYEIEFDKPFNYPMHEAWGYQDIHDYYKKRRNAFTSAKKLAESSATVFTVIRDPVKRLISCYRNRVVDLKDLEKTRETLIKMELSPEPDLNAFVDKLEAYRQANKSIEHHSRSQHQFLQNTLEYVDTIFSISELDQLKDFLAGYKSDLELRSEKSGGTSFELGDLTEQSLEKAIHFYGEDYKLLADYYNPEAIREQYHRSAIS